MAKGTRGPGAVFLGRQDGDEPRRARESLRAGAAGALRRAAEGTRTLFRRKRGAETDRAESRADPGHGDGAGREGTRRRERALRHAARPASGAARGVQGRDGIRVFHRGKLLPDSEKEGRTRPRKGGGKPRDAAAAFFGANREHAGRRRKQLDLRRVRRGREHERALHRLLAAPHVLAAGVSRRELLRNDPRPLRQGRAREAEEPRDGHSRAEAPAGGNGRGRRGGQARLRSGDHGARRKRARHAETVHQRSRVHVQHARGRLREVCVDDRLGGRNRRSRRNREEQRVVPPTILARIRRGDERDPAGKGKGARQNRARARALHAHEQHGRLRADPLPRSRNFQSRL